MPARWRAPISSSHESCPLSVRAFVLSATRWESRRGSGEQPTTAQVRVVVRISAIVSAAECNRSGLRQAGSAVSAVLACGGAGVGLCVERHRSGVIRTGPWREQEQQPRVGSCVHGMTFVGSKLE